MSALSEEVEQFVLENQLDASAAGALRSCTTEVARAVLGRGDMKGARNASSAVMMRIKEAKASQPLPSGLVPPSILAGGSMGPLTTASGLTMVPPSSATLGGADPAVRAAVEEFLRANDVDERAQAALRIAPEAAQRAVLGRGDLGGARNPSSALLTRIKDAKAAIAAGNDPSEGYAGYSSQGAAAAQPAAATATADQYAATLAAYAAAGYDVTAIYKAMYPSLFTGTDAANSQYLTAMLMGQQQQGGSLLTASVAGLVPGMDAGAAASASSPGVAMGGGGCGLGAEGSLFGLGMTSPPLGPMGHEQQLGLGGACGAGGGSDHWGYVKMRGLPFNATKEDILHFFTGFNVSGSDVTLGTRDDGRPSGEAFVRFPNEQVARQATAAKNKQSMNHRYIELFLMSLAEVQRANLPVGGTSAAPGMPSGYAPIAAAGGLNRASPY